MKKLAIILGTRPEIIKLAPVIIAFKESKLFSPLVISSGQHQSMAEQAFNAFGIVPDIKLDLMRANQTPVSFLGLLLPALEKILTEHKPAGVAVQGDTTTALGGALSAFHLKLPIAHVEAGLRTHDIYSPFPEEMNRLLVSRMTALHFCATEISKANLVAEGVTSGLHVVGNTVVDALLWMEQRITEGAVIIPQEISELIGKSKKLVLVTGHRRENFDEPLTNLCRCLKKLSEDVPEAHIVYPVHLNPNVQSTVFSELGKCDRVHLIAPLDYPAIVSLMRAASLIITDSGGIQEEAPTFGKKVLVTRTHTERPEAVTAGCSEVFPLDRPDKLLSRATELLSQQSAALKVKNPYGDGTSAKQIKTIVEQEWR